MVDKENPCTIRTIANQLSTSKHTVLKAINKNLDIIMRKKRDFHQLTYFLIIQLHWPQIISKICNEELEFIFLGISEIPVKSPDTSLMDFFLLFCHPKQKLVKRRAKSLGGFWKAFLKSGKELISIWCQKFVILRKKDVVW